MKVSSALFSAAIFTTVSASAATVVSNLDSAGGSVNVGPFDGSGGFGGADAQAFTTSSSESGWNLDSLTFSLREVGTVTENLVVGLYSYNSGSNIPDQLLVSLTGANPDGPGYASYSFTPTSAFILQPGTTYVAVLTAANPTGTDHYGWRENNGTTESGDPGWSIADQSRQNTNPGFWISSNPLQMSVEATAIPETATAPLVLAGALGAFLVRRRRR